MFSETGTRTDRLEPANAKTSLIWFRSQEPPCILRATKLALLMYVLKKKSLHSTNYTDPRDVT